VVVYVNSHSSNFGVDGYGFLNAAEAAEYITGLTVVDQIQVHTICLRDGFILMDFIFTYEPELATSDQK